MLKLFLDEPLIMNHTNININAFNMDNILISIDKYSLDLLKQCMLSNSAASCFYTHLYYENNQSRLFLRVSNSCIKQNINVIKYV